MAANLIARYIWEVNALAKARHGLSLEELNEQWRDCYLYDDKDIVRKTWWEHRNQIGLQFGIDIEYDKPNKRYFIKSRNEINRPAIQEWMLNSFAVGNMLLQGKDLRGRILCEHIPSGYEYLTEIITARSSAHEELRTYALDRIQDLHISNQKFKMPKDFDAEEMYEDAYGIVIGKKEKVERIEINVYNNQAKYFRSLPLHSSQREIETSDCCSVFEYYLKPTYDFIQELLSHGPDVEVIHPNSLRQLMKQRIEEMTELYK